MMWKHSCALVCVLAALLFSSSVEVTSTSDPSTLPLIQFNDLHYIGAFRVPSQTSNGDTFEIGGHPVAYNPARNSLFMGSRLGKIAEISIPQPVNSADVTALPRASFLQGFYEPTEGRIAEVPGVGTAVDGILVYGNRLYGTASVYYDANNEQKVSHFSRSLTLNQASFAGWTRVWESGKSGFVSGDMALVPQEWQSALGGPAITGQYGTPIVWRTSWGPSAFAFDPTLVGSSAVPAVPLVYYSSEHQTLGSWSGSNPTYGATTDKGGVAIIAGTRSLLFFGRNGTGPYCYGNGTGDQSLAGTIGPDGAHWCYDPTNAAKGPHAYPYQYQIWAYDLAELAAVKRGEKKPWDVRPYGVWPFSLPIAEASVRITGIGYDSATQTIYLSQMRAEKDGYANRPVVHVLRVGGVAGSPLPAPSTETEPPATSTPPPTTSPTPTTSSKVTAVSIASSKPSPQAPGTTITFTATPTGGGAPHEYMWMVHDDVKWNLLRDWSTSNTFDWTPATANAKYKISVGVRSAGKSLSEASVNLSYPIGGTSTTTAPAKISSVALTANKAAPQAPSTTVTFSALPAGGTAPYQFKWRVFNGSTWSSGAWTTTSTYAWTPTTANAAYRVEVWARSSGNTADAAEALNYMSFPIAAPTTTTAPASTSSVSVTLSKPSPQPVGTSILVTATPAGGVAPHQYQWQVYDGTKWTVLRAWSTGNTLTWTPTVASSGYILLVQVRSAGATAEEARSTTNYNISAAPTTTTTTTARATAVTLTANKPAPQVKGTAITWTASNVVGGVGPHQYKFNVWNGSGWIVGRGWSTTNTFIWIPTLANPYYKVQVWVRSAGNSTDNYETQATSANYPIK